MGGLLLKSPIRYGQGGGKMEDSVELDVTDVSARGQKPKWGSGENVK